MYLKRLLLTSFLFLVTPVVNAQTCLVFCGGSGGAVVMNTPLLSWGQGNSAFSNTTANFGFMVGNVGTGQFTTSAPSRESPSPIAGTITGLEVQLPTSVATGSYEFVLVKNGSATLLLCTISSGTTCSDTSDSVSVIAGDLLCWEVIPTSTPTAIAANATQISALFTSTSNQESLVLGAGSGNMSTTAAQYAMPQGLSAWNATENLPSAVMPSAGVIDSLWVSLGANPGAAASYEFTLMHNGAASTIVAGNNSTTCAGTGGGAQACNDIAGCTAGALTCTHSITVAAGDTISLQQCPSNGTGTNPTTTCQANTNAPTATSARYGFRFTPTVQNKALLLTNGFFTNPAINTTDYNIVSGTGVWSATESPNGLNIAPSFGAKTMTLGDLYVAQCPGPGAGVTRTVTLRNNGAIGSPPTVTVAAGTTACPTYSTAQDNTHTYAPSAGGDIDLQTTVSGSNSALTQFKVGMTVIVQ